MRIRTYLFIFALAIVTPMIAFVVIAVLAFDHQQRAAVERGGVETARALMNAVDRELTRAVSTLQALGTARSLERDDLATFYEDARRVLASRREWITIILIAPSGQLVMDLTFPFGTPLPRIVERGSFEAVLQARQPVIGSVAYGPIIRRHAFPVRVPIWRDGTVAYVLTGVLELGAIDQILRAQQIPDDWVGTVFDSKQVVAARTRGGEKLVGRPIASAFARLLATDREGWAIARTIEGASVYTAFSRSALTEWGVGLGIPQPVIDGPLRRSLWTIAGGGVLLLLAALIASTLVGQRIAGSIGRLAAAARAFGERETGPLADTGAGPEEVNAVAHALVEAGDLLRARAAERSALLASAQAATAEAEAANRAKDEFLATLSHELRTPLNAIMGWAQVLERGAPDAATAQRALESIQRNTRVQTQMVEDLLDVSRIVAGKARIELRPIELAPNVEAALETIRSTAEAKGVGLTSSLASGPTPVMGDPDRVQQIVWNLVSNAVKFTPRGGSVTVTLERTGSEVKLTVSDTGSGIRPEVLPHVFERFQQADSSLTRVHGGLGIGLAIVRHLVELHGGQVHADSAGEGQGAVFVVILPLAVGRIPTEPLTAMSSAVSPQCEGLRVLVVDDEPDAREIVATFLRNSGATVRTSGSVAEALRALDEQCPDIVVADLAMPDEDGFALVERIRKRPEGRCGHVPVVALTAHAGVQMRVRALTSGFSSCIVKPVEPTELAAVVSQAAGRPTR